MAKKHIGTVLMAAALLGMVVPRSAKASPASFSKGDEGTGIEWDTPNKKSDGNSSCCKEALDAMKATLSEENLKRDIIKGLGDRGFHFIDHGCYESFDMNWNRVLHCDPERYELKIKNGDSSVTIEFEGFGSASPNLLLQMWAVTPTTLGQVNTCVTSKSYAEFMAKTNNLAKIDELIKEIKDSLKVSDH